MKKTLALLLSFLMIAALTACTGQSDAPSTKPTAESYSDSAEENTKELDEYAASEASEEVIPSQDTTEDSEESVSSTQAFDSFFTDDTGRVYTTYTAKELVEKIVAMDEAGTDLFNDVSELSPDGYIQIPVHFINAGDGSRADEHDSEVYMLIKEYRELNGEPGFILECSMLKNITDAGIDALSPTLAVYFYDNDAPENKAYAGSALQEKLTNIITAADDPYQSFLIRCRISELSSVNTTIKGEKAAHGYSCSLFITDIVPIGD